MISIPIAVYTETFRWQLDLFWYNHSKVYGDRARSKTKAVVIRRNLDTQPRQETLDWNIDIPHLMCESYFDYLGIDGPVRTVDLPLNVQVGLEQITKGMEDELVIEILDCDMFHIRKFPEYRVRDDELIVADMYEPWHLCSLGKHRNVIDIYFENGGRFYNGGFVPIICKVRTLRKILPEWIAVHRDILSRSLDSHLHWWAGMFALQAACEKAQVRMIAEDCCYFPGINALSPEHYICHYSCDKKFDKRKWPDIDQITFEDNLFYQRVGEWMDAFMAKH